APKPTSGPASPQPSPSAAASAQPAASPSARPLASPSPVAAAASVPRPPDVPGFPSKPIQIITPYAPGGSFDALARQLAIPLQSLLGQPVVVQNVPGGGTRIGARQFNQSAPDGHTLMYMADSALFASTLVEPAEGFDMTRWVWVAGVRRAPSAVVVRANGPWQTIQDVIAGDRAGERFRMPHNGIGGFLPLHAVLVQALGLQNVGHVGGFQGTGDMTPSIIRGDTDGAVGNPITSWMQYIRSGEVRPIVVLEPQRYPLLPDVPTAREQNLPNAADLELLCNQFLGIATVPGTPPERARVLEWAVLSALQDPAFRQWARDRGDELDMQATAGQQFSELKQLGNSTWPKYADALRQATG
ncbi:MAG TPA: tripartite tricarboxylate transporter substrate binding protein, partial [Chloroflexota bacterium]